jgi:hypothetical protein
MMHTAIIDATKTATGLRAALLSGSLEEIEMSVPALTDAARDLHTLELEVPPAGSPKRASLKRELLALKRLLDSTARLIHSGAALEQGWAQLLSAAASGYTASGVAAPLTATTHLSVEG